MAGTMKTTYKGWDITVRCLKFRAPENTGGAPASYTASGRAVLSDTSTNGEWTDPRPHVVTLSGRIFDTTAACTEVLTAEIQILIDALKRAPEKRLDF